MKESNDKMKVMKLHIVLLGCLGLMLLYTVISIVYFNKKYEQLDIGYKQTICRNEVNNDSLSLYLDSQKYIIKDYKKSIDSLIVELQNKPDTIYAEEEKNISVIISDDDSMLNVQRSTFLSN